MVQGQNTQLVPPHEEGWEVLGCGHPPLTPAPVAAPPKTAALFSGPPLPRGPLALSGSLLFTNRAAFCSSCLASCCACFCSNRLLMLSLAAAAVAATAVPKEDSNGAPLPLLPLPPPLTEEEGVIPSNNFQQYWWNYKG